MNREFLKELGLEDDAIEKIMKEHGKAVNDYKKDAAKVDGLESQIEDLDGQIKERDQQLKKLKKVDPEALQAEIDRLEGVNETTTSEYQAKLDKQAKDFAVESALRDAKAKNPKLAKNALDLEAITYKDGKLIGIEEQLTAVKESDAYLFGEEQPPGLKGRQPHETGNKGNEGLKNPFSDEHFNLTEQGRLLRDDPELYKQLKAQV